MTSHWYKLEQCRDYENLKAFFSGSLPSATVPDIKEKLVVTPQGLSGPIQACLARGVLIQDAVELRYG
jgi:hypothetical protein